MNSELVVARDFSRSPAGRYVKDGPYSGEAFRENLLRPALIEHERVVVDLTGALGFGSSFLEEAFGGLVRTGFVSASELRRRLTVKSKIRTYVDRVWQYVDNAQRA